MADKASAVEAAVKLSDRYINDRFLPDKAIDVMDEASSALRLEAMENGVVTPDREHELENQLKAIQEEKEAAAVAEQYERAATLRQRELQLQQAFSQPRCDLGCARRWPHSVGHAHEQLVIEHVAQPEWPDRGGQLICLPARPQLLSFLAQVALGLLQQGAQVDQRHAPPALVDFC